MNNFSCENGWQAGAAQIDISPEKGIQIAGDIGRYRPVEEVRDPLFAKALILAKGKHRICIVQLDLLAIVPKYDAIFRARIAKEFGFPPEAIMLHCTQTHAAPYVGNTYISDEYTDVPPELWFIRSGDDRYNPVVERGIMSAIEQALSSMQPVTALAGRGVDGRVAFNRRFIMRDGTTRTHGGGICNPDILQTEGPVDPEVGVMLFVNDKGARVAALLHHTCHPCHGYPARWVTSGWPGAWARNAQAMLGPQCVPLVLNGFCGNIQHGNRLDPNYKDDYIDMAQKLTETMERIVNQALRPISMDELSWTLEYIPLTRRKPDAKTVANAQTYLREHPTPPWTNAEKTAVTWDYVYAHSNLDLHRQCQQSATVDFPVQVIRMGDVAIVAIPGEPFVEEQLRIKLKSPAPFTFCAHMSNGGCVSYIPTAEAFDRGGYETKTCSWSMLAPDSLTRIGDRAIRILKEIFRTETLKSGETT